MVTIALSNQEFSRPDDRNPELHNLVGEILQAHNVRNGEHTETYELSPPQSPDTGRSQKRYEAQNNEV